MGATSSDNQKRVQVESTVTPFFAFKAGVVVCTSSAVKKHTGALYKYSQLEPPQPLTELACLQLVGAIGVKRVEHLPEARGTFTGNCAAIFPRCAECLNSRNESSMTRVNQQKVVAYTPEKLPLPEARDWPIMLTNSSGETQ